MRDLPNKRRRLPTAAYDLFLPDDVGLISCPDLLPDLWAMADDFAISMKELLAIAG